MLRTYRIRFKIPYTGRAAGCDCTTLENGSHVVMNPLMSFLTGSSSRRVVGSIIPVRTLADVVLPPRTRRTLEQALFLALEL